MRSQPQVSKAPETLSGKTESYQLSGQKAKCVPLLTVSTVLRHHFVSLTSLNCRTTRLNGLPVLAFDSFSLTYLLPGTYSSTSYSPTSPLNASISNSSSSLTISTPDSPVGFTSYSYSGLGNVWTANDWGMGNWKSVYLPDGWYAVLGQGKVLWGAIPEKSLLPMSISSMGISYAGNCMHMHNSLLYPLLTPLVAACSPACSSHGTCIATNASATCKCDEGWAGSTCDSCATGYYGTSCTGKSSEAA